MPFDLQAPLRGNNLFSLMQDQQDKNLDRQVKSAQIQQFQNKGQDLDKLAEQAAYKAALGVPLTPGDNAAIQAQSALKGGQTFFDPNTGQMIQRPDLATNLQNKGFLPSNSIGGMMAPRETDASLPHDLDGMQPLPMNVKQPQAGAPIDNGGLTGPTPGFAPNPARQMTMDQLRSKAMPTPIQPQDNTPVAVKQAQQANTAVQQHVAEKNYDLMNNPLDQNQGNAALFADRMSKANPIINNTEADQIDPNQVLKSKIPFIGNYLVSPNFQMADQGKKDFLNANLRKESGALIGPDEIKEGNKQYFPMPGDGPQVLAQKARNRITAINGVARQGGPQYQVPVPAGAKQVGTSGGKPVYQLPDGTHVMEQ